MFCTVTVNTDKTRVAFSLYLCTINDLESDAVMMVRFDASNSSLKNHHHYFYQHHLYFSLNTVS